MPERNFEAIFAEAQAEINAENGAPAPTEPVEGGEGTEPVEPVNEPPVDGNEGTEPTEPTEPPAPTEPTVDKTGQGFARLRRERDEANRKISEMSSKMQFFENFASQNGMSVDQLIEHYDRAQMNKQAEAQGVPVEVLQRQRQQEQQTKSLQDQVSYLQQKEHKTAFNNAFGEFTKEHPMTQQEVEDFFVSCRNNGINLMTANTSKAFEVAYYTLNPEKMQENARQRVLETQKKNSKKAPIAPTGGVSNPSSNPTQLSDEEIDARADAILKGTIYDKSNR